MKKLALVVLLGSMTAAIFAYSPADKQPVIHPAVHATNNDELTAGFLNGLEFSCPEGTNIHWSTKLPPQSRSYSAIVNDIESAVCR